MKIKQLLLISAMVSAFAAKSQCTINIGNFHQDSILCQGGNAGFSLNIVNGAAPYIYTFDGNVDTLRSDSFVVWAQTLIDFGTQYGTSSGDWSASDVLGAPDVYPSYGDIGFTWTNDGSQQRDYLVVGYPPTNAKSVRVYETYDPGSNDTVYVREASSGTWFQIYSTTAVDTLNQAIIRSYGIPGTIGAVDAVRLAVDDYVASSYYEIDAIGLTTDSLVLPPLVMNGITAGTYAFNITDNNGCTFDTTLVFNDHAVIEFTQNLTICSNETVYVGGNAYNTTGNYTDVLISVNGCDSTVYTNLTVNPGNATFLNQSFILCAGDSVIVGPYIHKVTGLYSDTLMNAGGCDSVITTDLYVYTTNVPEVDIIDVPTIDITFGGTASASDSYSGNPPADAFNGDTATTGWGNSGYGLPSWLQYDYGTGNAKVVKGYSFICSSTMTGGWGYSGYDPQMWNLQAFNGTNWINLDSQREDNPVQDIWYHYNVMNNTPYEKYRLYFTGSIDGSYVIITEMKFLTTEECSNKAFVALPNAVSDSVTSYQWMVNGVNVGMDTSSFMMPMFHKGDTVNCVITTNNNSGCAVSNTGSGQLIIQSGPVMPMAMVNQDTLHAGPLDSMLTYQWIDCSNGNAVAGATTPTFVAPANGNYAVVITSGSCPSDTSACVPVTAVGIATVNANASNVVSIYPNPNTGEFVVNTSRADVYNVVNSLGQVVQSIDTNGNSENKFTVSGLQAGVYYIIGTTTGTNAKVVVTK